MIAFIYSKFLENHIISTDTRKIEKGALFFALKGENFNANKFAQEALNKGASYAVIDEETYKLDDRYILVDNVLETLQELATYHREKLGLPIISLTGSNGKTTTKELIYNVLKEKYITVATQGNLNNHIGVPITLLELRKDTEIAVVEMGANHIGEIGFLSKITKPDYGYITNFGKAHLEGFGSLEGVVKGKSELYDYLRTNDGTAFVNYNDNVQKEKSKGIETIGFGTPDTKYHVELVDSAPFVSISINGIEIKTNLIGQYNFSNVAIAITMGLYFKVPMEQIKKAIENYHPTNNRSQIIEKKTNKIILDAYNANPSSMELSIMNFDSYKTYKMAILGDMFELGEYADKEHQYIVDLLEKSSVDKVYLLGEHFLATKVNTKKIEQFKCFDDFKDKKGNIELENSSVLIKASRGMALERVLDLL